MLVVQKYGGTSVRDPDRIRAVAERVARARASGDRVVVVVSAMAGETDRLIALARALSPRPPARELDALLASGEQVSSALLAIALRQRGVAARSFVAHQARVETDSAHARARILRIDGAPLMAALEAGEVPVVAGFQGLDRRGNITTLGRGGSDTSAVAVAASLRADLCEIYTDVSGVFSADPRICPGARRIPRVSYDEMLEMASLGAKVLQIRSVEVAKKFDVPLRVRSSYDEEEGTMVVAPEPALEEEVVRAVALDEDQARITLLGVRATPQMPARLFAPLAEAGIVVDMIVQSAPEGGRTNLSFTVTRGDLAEALACVEPAARALGAEDVAGDEAVVKVSIVGLGMRSHAGVAARMFSLLGDAGIPIHLISTSEIKVSCLVPPEEGRRAARILHEGFVEAP